MSDKPNELLSLRAKLSAAQSKAEWEGTQSGILARDNATLRAELQDANERLKHAEILAERFRAFCQEWAKCCDSWQAMYRAAAASRDALLSKEVRP